MDGLYALITAFAVWFAIVSMWRAARYKSAYNDLAKQQAYITMRYDELAAAHYARRAKDRSLMNK